MKVNISSLHFKTDSKLVDFINEKCEKLSALYEGSISCDVVLKLDKSESIENKVAELRIQIPGNDLFSKKQCKTFEEAVDQSVDALKKQITKHKEKQRGV